MSPNLFLLTESRIVPLPYTFLRSMLYWTRQQLCLSSKFHHSCWRSRVQRYGQSNYQWINTTRSRVCSSMNQIIDLSVKAWITHTGSNKVSRFCSKWLIDLTIIMRRWRLGMSSNRRMSSSSEISPLVCFWWQAVVVPSAPAAPKMAPLSKETREAMQVTTFHSFM